MTDHSSERLREMGLDYTAHYCEMTEVKHDASYIAHHTTHHADCGCLTVQADAMRDELLARIEELSNCENCPLCAIQAKRADEAEKREKLYKERWEFIDGQLAAHATRADVAEAERDRLAWMLERIRDSEYDRMSDADALADLAARYDARHEDGDG